MPKIRNNFILILLTIIAFIAPDFLAQIFSDSNQAVLSGKFLLGLSCFAIFFSFLPSAIALFIILIFACIELIQFCNLFYYGTLITSAKLGLLFKEFDEVLLVAKEAINFMYLVPFIILIPYGILWIFFNKFESIKIKSKLAIIPVLLCLSIIPYRVHNNYYGANYYPDPTDHSLRNSLYATTNYLYNYINPNNIKITDYKEYQVNPINRKSDNDINIILIIGESANYKNMSLFDYERETNPLLSTLKEDSNFFYSKGMSSGVSTPVSIPLLLNCIYEPNNIKAIESKKTNLFNLAKQNGFKTFYVSAQSGALLTNIGMEFIDYKLFRNKALLLFERYQDEALLKIIPDLDYAEQNFIVINQRNAHAPYEQNYAHNPEFNYFSINKNNYKQYRIDSYDNAMRYNDFLIYKMIQFYKEKFKGPTYIFFTSDHGEVLDSSKVAFGHAELNEEVAEVPFLAYYQNDNLNKSKQIKSIKQPIFHYELSHIIAEILGFEVKNPNIEQDIFYIHGVELSGNGDFIKYRKK